MKSPSRIPARIAVGLATLALAGCDVDSSEADLARQKLLDVPPMPMSATYSLPSLVDAMVESGEDGYSPLPGPTTAAAPAMGSTRAEAVADDGAGGATEAATSADATDLREQALAPSAHDTGTALDADTARATQVVAWHPIGPACCGAPSDEMPRYDWVIDATSPADN